MKPSDFTIIWNGLEMVGKALVKRNQAEIKHAWRNSSLSNLSNSVINFTEEKLSSATALSSNPKAVVSTVKETLERGSMITEGIKQYAAYSLKQNKKTHESNTNHEFEIDHPLLKENIPEIENQDIDNLESVTHARTNNLKKENIAQNINKIPASINVSQAENLKVSTNLHESNVMTPSISKSFSDSSSTTVSENPMSNPISKPYSDSSTTVSEEFVQQNLIQQKPKLSKSRKLQELNERAQEKEVPASQVRRAMVFGGLFGRMALGAAVEKTKQTFGLVTEKNTSSSSLLSKSSFLTEANVTLIVNTLCKARGAALKLGQMLSIQDNSMINPQLAAVFERVRQSADYMPSRQMEKVLNSEFGSDWRDKFAEFHSKPFAAASIGQVHHAKLLDGSDVALKIQYPGVAEGIDSDIRSLTGIVKLTNMLPKGVYLENIMAVAKRELRKEVDYLNEAKAGVKFKELLKDNPEYYVPHVYDHLCTSNILTTELVYGDPIDKLQTKGQDLRNKVCERLLKLCLREIFIFEFMQTDPNWSNFLYNDDTDQIILLDFGACNSYSSQFVDTYMKIIKGAADQDRDKVLQFSRDLGFLTGYETKVMEEAHVDAVMILGEAFACQKEFDFKQQNMTERIHHLVPIMLEHRLTPPPDESYSLHRKMSGIFLLCTKLGAEINCGLLFNDVYKEYLSKKQAS